MGKRFVCADPRVAASSIVTRVLRVEDEPTGDRAVALDSPETQRYLDDTVRVWLGASREVDAPGLPPELARLFLRLEEYERPERDRWGCWDYTFSENHATGRLLDPEIDRWLAQQRGALAATTPLEPLWPRGHRFAVCLTHDVDLVSERSTPAQMLRFARAGLAGGGVVGLARPPVRIVRSLRAGIARAPDTRDTLERTAAIEAERGVVSSFFFTVPPRGRWSRYDCAYGPADRCRFRARELRIADVMCTLAAEGFDVGLHGSYRAALETGALDEQRDALRSATGLEVRTTRQHFLRWDVRTTPRAQEDAGFEADSSLGFNRNVGFRAGTSLPYHHFDVTGRRRLSLVEAPLIVEDTAVLGEAALGLGPAEARELVLGLLDEVAEVGGAATLLFHPDKLARPEWCALYEATVDHALEQGAWVTSLDELQRWWRDRESRLLDG